MNKRMNKKEAMILMASIMVARGSLLGQEEADAFKLLGGILVVVAVLMSIRKDKAESKVVTLYQPFKEKMMLSFYLFYSRIVTG